MSLRRKMVIQIAAMIVGLLLVSAASLWGLNGLREDYSSALGGYEELRQVFEIGAHLAAARSFLASGQPDRARAAMEVERASARISLARGASPRGVREGATIVALR